MTCPECGARGRPIKPATLQAQVDPPRLAALASAEGWAMCTGEACDVAYFQDDAIVVVADIRSVPFHKSTDVQRLACFCFGHSVAAVQADVDDAGVSRIQARIKRACRAGEDDCLRKNPAGRCCLGNVGQVVKSAKPAVDPMPVAVDQASACDVDCCNRPPSEVPSPAAVKAPRAGWLTGGAVVAGVLASACCWIPLLAVGLGTSAAGAGALFAAWRLPLLAIAAVFLAGGFYLAYRKPRCAPGAACETPAPRVRQSGRALLWLSTALVIAMALVPEYAGALFGDAQAQPSQVAAVATVVYSVDGMSCRACESHATEAVGKIAGVASVRVSYDAREAAVAWTTAPDHPAVFAALKNLGYTGKVKP